MVREGQALPVIQLVGLDKGSKELIIRRVAQELGTTLFRLPVDLIPKAGHELDLFARLWARESVLARVALYLDAHDLDVESEAERVQIVQLFLARSGGLFFLNSRDTWNYEAAHVFDVNKPTAAEQVATWEKHFTIETIAPRLAAQFHLNLPTIEQIASQFDAEVPLETAWQACLAETRPGLDLLAQRIVSHATWDDIVLPDEQMGQLREIAGQIEHHSTVYDQWGWRSRMTRGLGNNRVVWR